MDATLHPQEWPFYSEEYSWHQFTPGIGKENCIKNLHMPIARTLLTCTSRLIGNFQI